MTKEQFEQRYAKKIPDSPGVYFFLGQRKSILYIGKATSLKSRVRSYFTDDVREKRSPLIEKVVADAKTIEWTTTDSVLEALLLETNLIRTHRPIGNTDAKDDKSFNHVVITNESFPRVLVIRGRDIARRFEESEIRSTYGPFTSGSSLANALKIIRKIFPFYDTRTSISSVRSKMEQGKLTFNRQIGIAPHELSSAEYERTIRNIELLFEGKKPTIVKHITADMRRYAKQREFEKAQWCKKMLFALTHIEDVALIKEDHRVYRDHKRMRFEGYDVAHLQGSGMVGVMTVVEGEDLDRSQYRKFAIKSITGSNDPAALAEILSRRLSHDEWPLPQCIVVDGGVIQKRRAESVLRESGFHIPVVAVVKDEFHRPKRILGPEHLVHEHERSILLANSEAHRYALSYHRLTERKRNFTK